MEKTKDDPIARLFEVESYEMDGFQATKGTSPVVHMKDRIVLLVDREVLEELKGLHEASRFFELLGQCFWRMTQTLLLEKMKASNQKPALFDPRLLAQLGIRTIKSSKKTRSRKKASGA